MSTQTEVVAPKHAERLNYVDTLRGVAAMAVLCQHVFESSGVSALQAFITISPGVYGVALFFLVSGFVIPFSVNDAMLWRQFAIRRITRIYPLLLAAFALDAALVFSGAIHQPLVFAMSAKQWIANILLVQDFVDVQPVLGVTWTLILEFAWYAIFAASMIVWSNRAGRILAIVFPAAMAILIIGSLVVGHRLPLGRIGMIYAAATGFQVFRYRTGQIGSRAFQFQIAAFLVLMMVGTWAAFGHFHHPTITFQQAFVPWLIAPALFFLITGTALRDSPLLHNPILSFLGRTSYSMYLLHPIAMGLVARFATGWLYVMLTTLLALCAGAAGYALVEKPGIRLGRWLSRVVAPGAIASAKSAIAS